MKTPVILLILFCVTSLAMGLLTTSEPQWYMKGRANQLEADLKIDSRAGFVTVVGKGPTERCAKAREDVVTNFLGRSDVRFRWYERAISQCEFEGANLPKNFVIPAALTP